MNKKEKVGLALLASAAILGGKLFCDFIRKGKWYRFW